MPLQLPGWIISGIWNGSSKNTSSLHTFIPSPGHSPPGMTLPRSSWVRLNCLCTGIGLFCSTKHKWGLVPSTNCRCEAEEQMADHVLAFCPMYHPPNETLGLAALDDDTVDWLQTTELASDRRSAQTKKNENILKQFKLKFLLWNILWH